MEPIKAAVQSNVVQLSQKCRSALQCLFNTAFFVGHQELAFRKFAGVCELQKRNGVQFGDQYKNDKGCKTFISNIAQVEKGKIQSAVSDSRFVSTLSDVSTVSGIVEQKNCVCQIIMLTRKPDQFVTLWILLPYNLLTQMEFYMQSIRVFLGLA